jgi:hypothetical protein
MSLHLHFYLEVLLRMRYIVENRQDKNRTHLCHDDGSLPDVVTITDFCETNLNIYQEPDWRSFVLGYASHVFADLRWTESVWEDYVVKIKLLAAPNEPLKNIYNQEVCQIDFDLFKKEDWAGETFALLAKSKEYAMEPWLTAREISQYREKTINWLSHTQNEPRITPEYITEAAVREFIKTTTNELRVLIKTWKDFIKI